MNDSKEIGEDWELAICLTSCVWLLDNGDGEGGINPLVAKKFFMISPDLFKLTKILHWLMSLSFPIVFITDWFLYMQISVFHVMMPCPTMVEMTISE